jgi:transmembrane protein
MISKPISNLLDSPALLLLARILLTFMFWSSGFAKLINFQAGIGEMQHFGLEPAWLFNVLTIIVQLGGSLLIIVNRGAWLGCGALAVFTIATIPLAHGFWNMEQPAATLEMYVVMEHITVVGGLMVAAILSQRARRPSIY